MEFVKDWEQGTLFISDLKAGDIFTEVPELNKLEPRSGVYLFVGKKKPGKFTESLNPYKAIDLLDDKGDYKLSFVDCVVRKGILTKQGHAMVAGLLASGVDNV